MVVFALARIRVDIQRRDRLPAGGVDHCIGLHVGVPELEPFDAHVLHAHHFLDHPHHEGQAGLRLESRRERPPGPPHTVRDEPAPGSRTTSQRCSVAWSAGIPQVARLGYAQFAKFGGFASRNGLQHIIEERPRLARRVRHAPAQREVGVAGKVEQGWRTPCATDRFQPTA